MKYLERFMDDMPLTPPTDKMDLRMHDLFLEASERREGLFRRPVALWQCAVASVLSALAGLLGGYVLSPGRTVKTETVEMIYVIHNDPSVTRNVFDTQASRPIPFLTAPTEPEVQIIELGANSVNTSNDPV